MDEHKSLNEYLFIRCFSKKKYLDDFVSGRSVYMNSISSFWNIENDFQGDPDECTVIPQKNNAKWVMWAGNGIPEKRIDEVEDFSMSVAGYLYCVFAIPKAFFSVKNGELYIDEESDYREDFFHFLNEYREKTGHAYVCIFDANTFIVRLAERLKRCGYQYLAGFVTYRNRTIHDRIGAVNCKKIEEIVLFKQEKYSYQHEFRFIVLKNGNTQHIEIPDVTLSDIVFLQAEYNKRGS